MGTLGFNVLKNVPPAGIAALAIGVGIASGLVMHSSTSRDGTRFVHRRYAPDYDLVPTSRVTALESLQYQRVGSGALIAVGSLLAMVGGANLARHGALTLVGAMTLGAGIGQLMKLDGAERDIPKTLPKTTPVGESPYRHQTYYWGQPVPVAHNTIAAAFSGQQLGLTPQTNLTLPEIPRSSSRYN